MSPRKDLSPHHKDRLYFETHRIIDANFNRAKEGLRVCEDIARFHLKSPVLTKNIRGLRHRLTDIIASSSIEMNLLFKERNPQKDIGKTFPCDCRQMSFNGLFMANAQRTKEAVRVLEEFFKLIDLAASKHMQKLRFDFYALEKKAVEAFPRLLDPR